MAINGYATDEIIITKAKEFGQKLNVDDLQFSTGCSIDSKIDLS